MRGEGTPPTGPRRAHARRYHGSRTRTAGGTSALPRQRVRDNALHPLPIGLLALEMRGEGTPPTFLRGHPAHIPDRLADARRRGPTSRRGCCGEGEFGGDFAAAFQVDLAGSQHRDNFHAAHNLRNPEAREAGFKQAGAEFVD